MDKKRVPDIAKKMRELRREIYQNGLHSCDVLDSLIDLFLKKGSESMDKQYAQIVENQRDVMVGMMRSCKAVGVDPVDIFTQALEIVEPDAMIVVNKMPAEVEGK